jgi:pectate lyase
MTWRLMRAAVPALAVRVLLAGFVALVCAPALTWAALPAGELWRENLLNYRVGYGRLATGGAGGTLCTVSTLNDSGAGSLRTCLNTSGPQWIIFSVSGTINILSTIQPDPPGGNDKTIDGRGQTITLNAAAGTAIALNISGVKNWIIHNVKMINTGGSFNVRILCSNTIWIDHYDTEGTGFNTALGIGVAGGNCYGPDNLLSTDITISWSTFHDRCPPADAPSCGSGMILYAQGSNTTTAPPDEPTMAGARLTLHHNWYKHGSDVRFPLMRYGWAHAFNNYLDNTDQGSQIRHFGQFVSENDIFECTGPVDGHQCGASGNLPRVQCIGDPEGDAGNCKVTNPWLVAGTETYQQINPGTAFNPASTYAYTLETANTALRSKLLDPATGAGVVPNPYNSIPSPGPASLIVKLLMSDGAGNTVTDSSGNALNGQRCEGTTCPAAGPTWQPGGLLFDGVNDGVRVANHALLNFSGDLTVGMRVNFDNLTNGNGLAAKTAASQTPYDWVFWLEAQTLCFAFGGSAPGLLCSPGTLTDLVNEHLVAVTKSATTVQFWIDGVSAGSGTMTGTMSNNTVPVWFGNDQIGYLLGTMRDARLYNGALTPAQMAAWATEGTLAAPTNLHVVRP